MIWISIKPCKTPAEGIKAYANKYEYKYTYSYIMFTALKCSVCLYPPLSPGTVITFNVTLEHYQVWYPKTNTVQTCKHGNSGILKHKICIYRAYETLVRDEFVLVPN
jgi:hypothetical protein